MSDNCYQPQLDGESPWSQGEEYGLLHRLDVVIDVSRETLAALEALRDAVEEVRKGNERARVWQEEMRSGMDSLTTGLQMVWQVMMSDFSSWPPTVAPPAAEEYWELIN